jgi:beta-galactosidase GanA
MGHMKTILDEAYSWFLEKIAYEGNLTLFLIEAGLGKSGSLDLGDIVLDQTRAIEVQSTSRRVKIEFECTIAWQCVDESYSTFDKYEQRDNFGKLQVITQSRYLDYVNECHGWYEEVIGKTAHHYRIWTENEVIDVVSIKPPVLKWENIQ